MLHIFIYFRYTSIAQVDVCGLVQSGRAIYFLHYHPPVYDIRRSLHVPQVPTALRPRQENSSHGIQDMSSVDTGFLCGRTSISFFDVRQSE